MGQCCVSILWGSREDKILHMHSLSSALSLRYLGLFMTDSSDSVASTASPPPSFLCSSPLSAPHFHSLLINYNLSFSSLRPSSKHVLSVLMQSLWIVCAGIQNITLTFDNLPTVADSLRSTFANISEDAPSSRAA